MVDQKPDDVVFTFVSSPVSDHRFSVKVIIRGRAPDACTCSRELWRHQLVRDEGVFKAVHKSNAFLYVQGGELRSGVSCSGKSHLVGPQF